MEDLDSLKTNPAVLKVYSQYVSLKKEGNRWRGLCPLHSEKSGSFFVHADMLYFCHGCAAKGNILQLVQAKDGISFKDAVAKVQEAVGGGNYAAQAAKVDAVFRPAVESTKDLKVFTLKEFASLERNFAANKQAQDVLTARGISVETAQRLHTGFKQSIKMRPDDKNFDLSDKGWLAFPCIVDGKVVAIKYRSVVRKAFSKQAGMNTTALYNSDTIDPFSDVILVEGECLTGDTEILTNCGWTRLDEYRGQNVLQWFKDGTGCFTTPLAYVVKDYDGDMITFGSKSGLVDQIVTESHRVIYVNSYGKTVVRPAKDTTKRPRFYRTAKVDCAGLPISEAHIRLQVMIQADASVESVAANKTDHHNSNGRDGWKIEVSKERKIVRIRQLLADAGYEYRESTNGRGNKMFRFNVEPGAFSKVFPRSFYNLNERQRCVFMEEVALWDSHRSKTGSLMYTSIIKENADLVQTVFHMSGVSAKFGWEDRGGTRSLKYWVCVPSRSKRGRHDLTSGTTIVKGTQPYRGKVYCVQVPSSFLLIRRNNVISVTGNCDAMVLEQAGYRACSIASASTNISPAEKDRLMSANRVILAGDADEVGAAAMEKLWRGMPERTYNLSFTDVKDANELYLKCKSKEEFVQKMDGLIGNALKQPMKDVYDIASVMASGSTRMLADHPNRLRLPWPSSDQMAILLPGSVTTVISTNSGMGKSSWVLQATLYGAQKYNETVLAYHCEMSPQELGVMVAAQTLKKNRNHLSSSDLREAAEILGNTKYYVGYDPELTTAETVLDLLDIAIPRLGCTVAVIDHIHHLCQDESNSVAQQSAAMQRIKQMAVKHQVKFIVVAQPRKANQQSKGKQLHMSDAKGSEAISSMADAMFAIHREVTKSDGESLATDTYESKTLIKALKTRSKGEGKMEAYLTFMGEFSAFSEIDYMHTGEPE